MSYSCLNKKPQPLFELSECKRERTFNSTIDTLNCYNGCCSCKNGFVGAQLKRFEYTPDAERISKPVYNTPGWKGWCEDCPQQAIYYNSVSAGGTLPGYCPKTQIRADPYIGI